jgi:tetratricopeptide (TPR) repeat protein
MSIMTEIIAAPSVQRLGWALLHFLWQGAAVAALLAAVLRLRTRARAEARYLVSCLALALLAACPAVTFLAESPREPMVIAKAPLMVEMPALPGPDLRPPEAREAPSGGGTEAGLPPVSPALRPPVVEERGPRPWASRGAALLTPALPWIVIVWAAGVLLLSARLAGGWLRVRRMTGRDAKPAAGWEGPFRRILEQLGIHRPVRLLESALVDVPLAIGWLRPAVLLPASALTGLAPEHIEAILAHELAHIRRLDYLANILQSAIETVLFYHPAVWWVSKQIRIERENCCDDLAVETCGSRETYVRALVVMEELRGDRPRLAAALDGGSLLARVRRLLRVDPPRRDRIPAWAAGLAAVVPVIGLGLALRLPGSAAEGGTGPDAAARDLKLIPRSSIEERIAAAEKSGEFLVAADLAEKLLGDGERAGRDLVEYRNRINPNVDYTFWLAARRLAVLAAHEGDFAKAEEWIAKAKEAMPLRKSEDVETEVRLCRAKVPAREALRARFAEKPSFEAGMDLLRARLELGEWPAARWLIEEMEARFAGDPKLLAGEFAKARALVLPMFEYVPEPVENQEGPPPRPARDARVEAIFKKLRMSWDEEGERALAVWRSWPVIRKAKFLNGGISQIPPHGSRWEPTEEEAAAFLGEHGLDGTGGKREKKALAMVRDMVRYRSGDVVSTKDERDALVAELASLGPAAAEDLLEKVGDAPWDSPAGREAGWAADALEKMGAAAVPGLAREVERCCRRDPDGLIPARQLRRLLGALAAVEGGAERTAALRRVLEVPDSGSAGMALAALSKVPGALTEEYLIDLYERNVGLHGTALRLLVKQGGAKALAVLDRDLPTAYAEAAYDLAEAAREIRSRLGMAPGPKPEPVRKTKKGDDPALWEGFEKTLGSPCPVLRIRALDRVARLAEDDSSRLASLLAIAREDPEGMVRARARERLAEVLQRHVIARQDLGESLTGFLPSFEAFVEMVEKREEGAREMVLAWASAFEGKEIHRRAFALALDRIDDEEPGRRVDALFAVAWLADENERFRNSIDPPARSKVSSAAIEGLGASSRRFKVYAISLAGIFRLREAVPALSKIVTEDPDPNLRKQAMDALGRIGDPSAIPDLEKAAAEDPRVTEDGILENRQAAAGAIAAIRRQSSGGR